MTNEEVEAWVDRLWRMSMATKLDREHRQLASALAERIVDEPEQGASLIAALVQQTKEV